jgi:hypothetical protein
VCYATTFPFRGATKCAAALFLSCSSSSHQVLLDASAPLFCDSLSLVVTWGRDLLVLVVVVGCCLLLKLLEGDPSTSTHTHTHNFQILLRSRPQHSQHTLTPNSQFLLRSP